jgi:hypothetical protein
MKREFKIILILMFFVVSEKLTDAAEPDPNQHVVAAFSVFKTGTLKEAKTSIARLDAELKKKPDNERIKNLKVYIKEIFLADHAVTQAIKNKGYAENIVKSKKRNLGMVSKPSTLSRVIDKQAVVRAKKELTQANAGLKKAKKEVSQEVKNLQGTIKRISGKIQLPDRELLNPVFDKLAERHGFAPTREPVGKSDPKKKD